MIPIKQGSISLSLWIISIAFAAQAPRDAVADVPREMTFQGRLTGNGNNPVSIEVRFYEAEAGGNLLWSESHPSVPRPNGLLTINIGSQTTGGVPDSALNTSEVWVGISVNGGDELTPRTRLVMAPYAAKSESAERLTLPGTLTSAVTVDPGGTIEVSGTARLRDPEGSASNEQLDLTGGYGLWRDDSGAGLDYSRLWLASPDGGEFVIGPRGGSEFSSLTRFRTDHLRLDGGYASFEGNSVFFRNPQAPASIQTWGIVVSGSSGRLNIGPSTDVPTQGQLRTSVLTIAPGAPQSSLIIENDGATKLQRLYVTDASSDATVCDLQLHAGAGGRAVFVDVDGHVSAIFGTRSTRGGVFQLNEPNSETPTVWARADTGTMNCKVMQITGGSDLAEPGHVSDAGLGAGAIQPGMVVSIDPANPGKLMLATEAYDRKVAGVISGAGGVKPGMIMKQDGHPATDGEHPIAMAGKVYVWCDADANGPIRPGDRLTTSATPGHAMKVTDNDKGIGAVIGKAMTELKEGKGLVLMLVQPQ